MLVIWRRVTGPSSSVVRTAGRIALAVSLSLLVVGTGVYTLSKSRSLQTTGRLVRRVDTDRKLIALTFDDGPTPGRTEEVLSTLRTYEASATFYVTGQQSAQYPRQVREIIRAGDELGSHTYTHRKMYFIPDATVAEEIGRTDAVLRSAGYTGPITFRPPGCKRLLAAPLYLDRTGRTTVTWDLEPDSIPGIADDADAMVDYVVDNVRPGSIVLMHVMVDSRAASREALPRILQELSADGYTFVTVSDLLRSRRQSE
ncbi:MAG: polysaccharide deacetylase family protein [Coriobacteriales bacterium]|nr:polysaccharide deacetylase family protein [Coriobacteriales bacterium]